MNRIEKHSCTISKEERDMNRAYRFFEKEARDMKKGKFFLENKYREMKKEKNLLLKEKMTID